MALGRGIASIALAAAAIWLLLAEGNQSDPGEPAPPVEPLSGPVDDAFVRRALQPGESPDGTEHGIVFVDVATGQGELWSAPAAEAEARRLEAAPTLRYESDVGHRWLQFSLSGPQTTPGLVGDRLTGKTYRFDPDQWQIIAGPAPEGLVVFQAKPESDAFPVGRVVVVDLANDPTGLKLTSRVALPRGRSRGAFLENGARLLLHNFIIDLGTGEVTSTGARSPAAPWPLDDGGALVIAPTGGAGNECCTIQRFDTEGQRIDERSIVIGPSMQCCYGFAETTPPLAYEQVHPSPDGRWLAWQTWMPLRSPPMTHLWPAVVLADVEKGQIILRAVRTSMEMASGQTGWLSDGSGLVVATRDGFSILRPDGSLEAIEGTSLRMAMGVPVAAPAHPNLLTFQGRAIGADGRIVGPDRTVSAWAGPAPQSYGPRDSGLDLGGDELRLVRSTPPQRDYTDIQLWQVPLAAHIERPPFQVEPRLRVATGGDSLNIRATAGMRGGVLGSLPDGTLLTVRGLPADETGCVEFDSKGACINRLSPGAIGNAAEPDPDDPRVWWLRVRADNGLEGWVSAEYLVWAE